MSRITEQRTTQHQATVGHTCDVCGVTVMDTEPRDWHHFMHQHGEWGNDSVDSIEYFDVCSVQCYADQLRRSIEKMKSKERTAEIDGKTLAFATALVSVLEGNKTKDQR